MKGSVANLNDLGALMSVVVISEENLAKMRKKGRRWSNVRDESIWEELRKRTVMWIHEARPTVRVIVMTEPEVREWGRNKGLTL